MLELCVQYVRMYVQVCMYVSTPFCNLFAISGLRYNIAMYMNNQNT